MRLPVDPDALKPGHIPPVSSAQITHPRQAYEEAATHIVNGTFPSRPAYDLAAQIRPLAEKFGEMTDGEWMVKVGTLIDECSGLRDAVVALENTENALADACELINPKAPPRKTPAAFGENSPVAVVELQGGSHAALFVPRRLTPAEAGALVRLVEATVDAWTDSEAQP